MGKNSEIFVADELDSDGDVELQIRRSSHYLDIHDMRKLHELLDKLIEDYRPALQFGDRVTLRGSGWDELDGRPATIISTMRALVTVVVQKDGGDTMEVTVQPYMVEKVED